MWGWGASPSHGAETLVGGSPWCDCGHQRYPGHLPHQYRPGHGEAASWSPCGEGGWEEVLLALISGRLASVGRTGTPLWAGAGLGPHSPKGWNSPWQAGGRVTPAAGPPQANSCSQAEAGKLALGWERGASSWGCSRHWGGVGRGRRSALPPCWWVMAISPFQRRTQARRLCDSI